MSLDLVPKTVRIMWLFSSFFQASLFPGPSIERITTSINTSSTVWLGYGALPSPPSVSVYSSIISVDLSTHNLMEVYSRLSILNLRFYSSFLHSWFLTSGLDPMVLFSLYPTSSLLYDFCTVALLPTPKESPDWIDLYVIAGRTLSFPMLADGLSFLLMQSSG